MMRVAVLTSPADFQRLAWADFITTTSEFRFSVHTKEETMRPTRFVLVCASLVTLVMSNAAAQEMRRGTVASLDESSGSITTVQSPDGTVGASGATRSDKFAVQDGLLFNALREGDKVTFISQEINGVNTITKLQKE
jgi:Cu/Ag efflux protein CusF